MAAIRVALRACSTLSRPVPGCSEKRSDIVGEVAEGSLARRQRSGLPGQVPLMSVSTEPMLERNSVI